MMTYEEKVAKWKAETIRVNALWVPYAETYRAELGERAAWYLGSGYLGGNKHQYMIMPWWSEGDE